MDNLTAGNPKAHRVRVHFNTASKLIYEGMPVCYSFDSTANWWGGSVNDAGEVTTATTVTEGALNAIRYIRVEFPDADNIHAFAGVVAKGGWVGKTTSATANVGQMLDIYVPNGAVVPVRTDQNCVMGRTVLAIHTAEAHLTGPYEAAGRAVAIAWETNAALDGAAGLILAKLDDTLFLYQKGDATSLLIDDQDTGNDFAVNQINVSFSQASGRATAFQIRAYAPAGTPSSWDYGLALDVAADLNGAAMSDNFNASGHWLNVGATTVTGNVNLSALRAGIYEGGGATFTSVRSLAPLSLAVQVATDPSNRLGMIYCRNDGAQAIDGFIIAESAGAINLQVADTTFTPNWGGSFPIIVGATTYYIPVLADLD